MGDKEICCGQRNMVKTQNIVKEKMGRLPEKDLEAMVEKVIKHIREIHLGNK